MMMDLVGLPLTSIVLFVLAGMLIGHTLWHRDRSGDAEKFDWLEKRYVQARAVARRRKQEQRETQKLRDQQQHEVGTMRQRYEANLVEMKTLQRSSQATSQELEAMRGQLRETADLLTGEQRRNDLLVNQLQEVLQSKTSDETEVAQELECSHQKAADMEEQLAEREVSLSRVSEQLEDLLPLRTESVEASLVIAEQKQNLEAQQKEVQRLRDQVGDSRDLPPVTAPSLVPNANAASPSKDDPSAAEFDSTSPRELESIDRHTGPQKPSGAEYEESESGKDSESDRHAA